MKKAIIAAAILAVFSAGGARAQDSGTAESGEEKVTLMLKTPKSQTNKQSMKKPAKKKKAAPQDSGSEYKFSAVERIPAYTFDKYTNPIIKENKPKKKAAKKKPAPKKPAEKPAEPDLQEAPEGSSGGQTPPPPGDQGQAGEQGNDQQDQGGQEGE